MSSDIEQRLIAVETRLAHFEQMAEDLSAVMAAQAGTLDTLKAHLRLLRERVGELEAGPSGSPQDEKPPPHY
ncbi:MAG: SlyX family protein [Magnetospirillum sp.]|nr:SlyX family protein [Magnetospirillum sp.]